jgi:hypothetical protein
MQRITAIAAGSFAAFSLTVAAADFQPGKYDGVILEHLRSAVQAAPLRSPLGEMFPAYVVEKRDGLAWDKAVAEADRVWGKQQPERGLFLRKYLVKGAPESRLTALGWRDGGLGILSGPNVYSWLEWRGPEREEKEESIQLKATDGGRLSLKMRRYTPARLEIPAGQGSFISVNEHPTPAPFEQPLARIDTAVADGHLTNVPTLTFPEKMWQGMVFDLLSFDENDQLTSWTVHFTPEAGGPEIQLSGSANARPASPFSVTLSDKARNYETLEYSPDLVLRARWVQLGGRSSYHESYEDGRLRKRVHTDPPKYDAQGRSIENVEEFP